MKVTVSFYLFITNIATIKYSEFCKILNDEFKHKKPSEALLYKLFESKCQFILT